MAEMQLASGGCVAALQLKVLRWLGEKCKQGSKTIMTTFDDRERGYENKFAHDADLKFKAESRRNKAVAEWAGAKLGLSGADLESYIRDVRRADLAEKGDEDVFRKVKGDLSAKGVKVEDVEIKKFMAEALAKAVRDIEAS